MNVFIDKAAFFNLDTKKGQSLEQTKENILSSLRALPREGIQPKVGDLNYVQDTENGVKRYWASLSEVDLDIFLSGLRFEKFGRKIHVYHNAGLIGRVYCQLETWVRDEKVPTEGLFGINLLKKRIQNLNPDVVTLDKLVKIMNDAARFIPSVTAPFTKESVCCQLDTQDLSKNPFPKIKGWSQLIDRK